MMDTDTLDHFSHLTVDGARPPLVALPHLSPREHTLDQHLLAHDTGLLLE